jgi:DNA-binding winged helix-turn-helix (wHTH) protein
VAAPAPIYCFGPFRLDATACRLFHGDTPVDLSPRLVDLLRVLAARPGDLQTKEDLLSTLWPDVFVTENTLTRAISDLRHALGDPAGEPRYIQTVARRGYRFIGQVEVHERHAPAATPPAPSADPLEPYRAWVQGRLQLERLSAAAVPAAIASFEHAASLSPADALARAGLSSARLMLYETTRARNVPDHGLLQRAVADAREACALGPSLGEAWATLAFVLATAGDFTEAAAAGRRATTLEPGSWRHQFRLAFATWGEERLRAVDRARALYPDFAFAHFVAAMVHIARRALPTAEGLLARGAAIQDAQAGRDATFPAAGLHWLLGLVCLASGRPNEALDHFARERAFETSGGIYTTEFVVNACCAIGCTHLALGEASVAAEAFDDGLARLPGHARCSLGRAIAAEHLGDRTETERQLAHLHHALAELATGGRPVEAAMVAAANAATHDRPDEGLAILERLLAEAPAGFAGWMIPIEPLLAPLRRLPRFERVLTMLAERAA